MFIGASWINQVRQSAAANRSRRFLNFIRELPRPLSILDLGGSAEMWGRWGVSADHRMHITLVNNHHLDGTHRHEDYPRSFIAKRVADALDLSLDDLSAHDIIFSNSMLEHLASRADQTSLAHRIMACGRPYFIQVPNKFCVVDPHFPHPFAPFFAAWPRALQSRALTWHRLGSGSRAPDYATAQQRMRFYTPISRRELKRLFPDADIGVEWSMGLPISLIASAMPGRSPASAEAHA